MVRKSNGIINKTQARKYLAALLLLPVVQTLTYFTIGQHSLRDKLLPLYFASLAHEPDSVFVRDFYVSDCAVDNGKAYLSHDLKKYDPEIKEKFKARHIRYDGREHFAWNDSTENKYKVVYNTWATRAHWTTLFGFYSVVQTETLRTQEKLFYTREAYYRWFLFFWIKTFERFESADISSKANW